MVYTQSVNNISITSDTTVSIANTEDAYLRDITILVTSDGDHYLEVNAGSNVTWLKDEYAYGLGVDNGKVGFPCGTGKTIIQITQLDSTTYAVSYRKLTAM